MTSFMKYLCLRAHVYTTGIHSNEYLKLLATHLLLFLFILAVCMLIHDGECASFTASTRAYHMSNCPVQKLVRCDKLEVCCEVVGMMYV